MAFQINLDTADGATAIHVDDKETYERIAAFKAKLDAKMAAEDEDEYEDEYEDEDEDDEYEDSVEIVANSDSDSLRTYLDSDDDFDLDLDFDEESDANEVVDSLLTLIRRMDTKLTVARELLTRQDALGGELYEAEVGARVDSIMAALMDAADYLPDDFEYEEGMDDGDIYAEAIANTDSDLADEIGVENADSDKLRTAFKILKRNDRAGLRADSQNRRISEALQPPTAPQHISRLDASDPSLKPWERQQIRDYQASRAPMLN